MSAHRASLGRRGERLAARFLKRKGYRILNRNWRCPVGEIDLVCADGDALVFVEVKSRTEDDFLPPEAGVGWRKRKKLERLALYYMSARGLEGIDWRVDAVSVTLRTWRRADLTLFRSVL